MDQQRLGTSWTRDRSFLLAFLCLLGAALAGAFVAAFGNTQDFELFGISSASRTLNQFTAVMLTCIALIVPLTSNLYTPRLVKLYATHPLIVTGLSLLLCAHTLLMAISFFPKGTALHRFLTVGISLSFLLAMAGALPFLYGISQFLRPAYFMPMLTKKGLTSLHRLMRGRRVAQHGKELFDTLDVVTNIALTGMGRGDRQLVLQALRSFHALLIEIIGSAFPGQDTWRDAKPYFVPGLAREGQEHLIRERIWPEAYVLAQTLKVMEMANRRQHELLAELAGHLVETAQLAFLLKRDRVVELHVMAFNTLLREALEEKDLRRFQNLSYHYRLLIEAFQESPERMHEATQHLLHYAKMAEKQNLHFAFETAVYDIGELVLSLARVDEGRAEELIRVWAGPLWQDCIEDAGLRRKVGWRTLLRLYWEARAHGFPAVAEAVFWRYLSDEAIHREQLELVLDENRELHYEFNDRMMRFAHFSPEAEVLAKDFLGGAWG